MRFLYPTIDEVLFMHEALIDEFGGSHGVRDMGLIEAALARPRSGYYSGLLEEAAALWESLSQNHAFIDGNKRIAVGATDTFLRMNGHSIDVSMMDAYGAMMTLYENQNFRYDELLKLLEQWTR